MSEDLCYQSIGELAAQLESKQISPVELTRAYLERIRELDGKLNSYITVTEDHYASLRGGPTAESTWLPPGLVPLLRSSRSPSLLN